MAGPGISLKDLQKKYQLSEDLLDTEVSEEHLKEVSRTIVDREILGTALGLSSEEVGQGKQPEIQRLEMLRRWKQKFAWKATYRELIVALLKWNRADYARDVSVLLTQSACEQPSACAATIPTSPPSHLGTISTNGRPQGDHVTWQKSYKGERERVEDVDCLQSELQKREGEMKQMANRKETVVREVRRELSFQEEVQESLKEGLLKDGGMQCLQVATKSKPHLSSQSTLQAISPKIGQSKKTLPMSPASDAAVAVLSSSQCEFSYTAVTRGQRKLYVRINGQEINGSPFYFTVYPDPMELRSPERVFTDLNRPYGIAINSDLMVVTEWSGDRVCVFDDGGQRVRTFGSHGDKPEQMICPKGIAVDDMGNIYVSSEHKLQRFTCSGELIKCIGQKGSDEGEFDDPCGVTVQNNQIYVCDKDNHRIQVFDLDLNFVQSIGSRGKERGKFDWPHDITFDTAGNMYVAEFGNKRVQMMDSSGQFIRIFGEENLRGPTAVHIADKYVYVSDWGQHYRIVVYLTSGGFITTFGRSGHMEGEFSSPRCITSCTNGFIYVCDCDNNRVQTF